MGISPSCRYFARNINSKNLLNYRILHHSAFLKMCVLVWRATHPFLQCKNTFGSLKYTIIVQQCYVIVWLFCELSSLNEMSSSESIRTGKTCLLVDSCPVVGCKLAMNFFPDTETFVLSLAPSWDFSDV